MQADAKRKGSGFGAFLVAQSYEFGVGSLTTLFSENSAGIPESGSSDSRLRTHNSELISLFFKNCFLSSSHITRNGPSISTYYPRSFFSCTGKDYHFHYYNYNNPLSGLYTIILSIGVILEEELLIFPQYGGSQTHWIIRNLKNNLCWY